jgi:hypothetical protein
MARLPEAIGVAAEIRLCASYFGFSRATTVRMTLRQLHVSDTRSATFAARLALYVRSEKAQEMQRCSVRAPRRAAF